jgi:NAD(P)-dependent dehydrogenase (short-subunit alcohol dehydrogenase family)
MLGTPDRKRDRICVGDESHRRRRSREPLCQVFADSELPRRVINISSGAADTALPGEAVYCVAKAGLEMLTRTLAAEQEI